MKLIELTQGFFAQVDDEDFERVNSVSWYAAKTKGNRWEARRQTPKPNRRIQRLHEYILGVKTNRSIMVDHRDGNPMNNQKVNLRLASHIENCRNARIRSHSSKFKGVSVYKSGQIVATITINKILMRLGSFTSELDAAKAYDSAALKHFGDFAKINGAIERP